MFRQKSVHSQQPFPRSSERAIYLFLLFVGLYYYLLLSIFFVTHESTTIIVINYRQAGEMLRDVFRFCRKR